MMDIDKLVHRVIHGILFRNLQNMFLKIAQYIHLTWLLKNIIGSGKGIIMTKTNFDVNQQAIDSCPKYNCQKC